MENDDHNFKDFDRVKTIHPELRDVKPGEELLVFKPKKRKIRIVKSLFKEELNSRLWRHIWWNVNLIVPMKILV